MEFCALTSVSSQLPVLTFGRPLSGSGVGVGATVTTGVGVAAADCAGAFIGGSTRSATTTASASTSATHKTVLRAFRISPHPR